MIIPSACECQIEQQSTTWIRKMGSGARKQKYKNTSRHDLYGIYDIYGGIYDIYGDMRGTANTCEWKLKKD